MPEVLYGARLQKALVSWASFKRLPIIQKRQWGPELLVFYNDPFIPNLQGKHPQALGTPFRIVWAEAYDQVAETFARPFRTGEAFSFPAAPFDLLVDGKLTRKYQQRVAEAFAAASTGEAPYDIECRIVRSDGVRWVRSRARLVSRPGDPVVLTGIGEDTTLKKQQSDALRQSEKLAAVGRLASSIAHEINNPLESVTNLLYLAQHTEDLHETRKFLADADQELRRASAISSQTLRFHKQTTSACEVFCSELFQTTLAVYEGRLKNSHIEVLKRKRAEHPVECFEGEIRQVLGNLVGNAIDAMPQGGKLYIRSREACNWRTGQRGIALTVADTGAGMTQEVLACIFEAFYSTKGIGGTGLGLWISKEIVDRHHGTLRVRSSSRDATCSQFAKRKAPGNGFRSSVVV